MSQITALETQSHHPDRLNLFLDGKFGFGISAESAAAEGLKVGQELTAEQISYLRRRSKTDKLYNAALRFLSFRPRSISEIKRYLYERLRKRRSGQDEARPDSEEMDETERPVLSARTGLSSREKDSLIDDVTGRLTKNHLLSDADFAKWWIRQRSDTSPRSRRLLKRELLAKGVSKEAVGEALEGKETGDELVLARAALARKIKKWIRLASSEREVKMLNFLLRRGFDRALAGEVVKEIKL